MVTFSFVNTIQGSMRMRFYLVEVHYIKNVQFGIIHLARSFFSKKLTHVPLRISGKKC